MIKSMLRYVGHRYCERASRLESNFLRSEGRNERIVEYRFILNCLLKTTPKKVLDVGTGGSSLPHLIQNCGFDVTAIDNIKDYWGRGMFNRHVNVLNDDITNTTVTPGFDLIVSVSVVEHIKDFNKAIGNMFSLLNPGGYLALTFPYCENEFVGNVYESSATSFKVKVPYICRVFSRENVNFWLSANNAKLIEQEFWKTGTGRLHAEGESLYPPQKAEASSSHQLSCILLQK